MTTLPVDLNQEITGVTAGTHLAHHAMKISKHPSDAGIDLIPSATSWGHIIIEPLGFYDMWNIPTGVKIGINIGQVGIIIGRSSSASKLMGCNIMLGVIDAGFTGELIIRLQVPSVEVARTRYGKLFNLISGFSTTNTALAQLIILPCYSPRLVEVAQLMESSRGSNGFGSTDRINYKACPGCHALIRPFEKMCADCCKEAAETIS